MSLFFWLSSDLIPTTACFRGTAGSLQQSLCHHTWLIHTGFSVHKLFFREAWHKNCAARWTSATVSIVYAACVAQEYYAHQTRRNYLLKAVPKVRTIQNLVEAIRQHSSTVHPPHLAIFLKLFSKKALSQRRRTSCVLSSAHAGAAVKTSHTFLQSVTKETLEACANTFSGDARLTAGFLSHSQKSLIQDTLSVPRTTRAIFLLDQATRK